MDLQKLIEQIAATGKEYGMFCITMFDTNSPGFATVVNCLGEEVAHYDYFKEPPSVLFTDNRFVRKTEDAITFLFDCDIHLWQLVKCCRTCVLNSGRVRWDITLRR